jgi:sialidase-1
MPAIEHVEGAPVVIYDNPIPHVRSRHGYFPNVVTLPSGEMVAAFVLGEAFEAANCTTWITRSSDRGNSWTLQGPIYDKDRLGKLTSDCLKIIQLSDGSMIAAGYRYARPHPDQPIVVSETGGLLGGDNIVARSIDGGLSWAEPAIIPRTWPELIELSGPCIQASNSDVLGIGALLTMPDGTNPSGQAGVLLRSRDMGSTWDDTTRFFQSDRIVPYESRIVEMQPGRFAIIIWAYDSVDQKSLTNLITVSHDGGHTWSDPIDTGIWAQASSLSYLGGDRLLTIHSHRGADPGLWVRLVDFANDRWTVLAECLVYGKHHGRQTRDGQEAAEMFRSLRFGQPSLVDMGGGEWLAVHWCVEEGQGKILGHRIRVTL